MYVSTITYLRFTVKEVHSNILLSYPFNQMLTEYVSSSTTTDVRLISVRCGQSFLNPGGNAKVVKSITRKSLRISPFFAMQQL